MCVVWTSVALKKAVAQGGRCGGRGERSHVLSRSGRHKLWNLATIQDKKCLRRVWQLSPSESSGLDARVASLRKVKKRCLKTKTQRAPGYWRRALPEDGDVETQPGPSGTVRKLKIGSLNCASAGSAFGALADFVADRVDVFGLQEARLSPRQAFKWQQTARSHGYKAWVLPGRRVVDSLGRTYYHNGLAVAVKSNLPSLELARGIDEFGEFLLVEVCGRCVGFVWQRPDLVEEGGLFDKLASFAVLHHGMVCVGDWNVEPHENPLAHDHASVFAAACGQDGALLPTRWQGARSIDYLISFGGGRFDAFLKDEVYGHHRAFRCDCSCRVREGDLHFLVPTGCYQAPAFVDLAHWQEVVARCYDALTRVESRGLPCTQHNVEVQWAELSGKLERAFSDAVLGCRSLTAPTLASAGTILRGFGVDALLSCLVACVSVTGVVTLGVPVALIVLFGRLGLLMFPGMEIGRSSLSWLNGFWKSHVLRPLTVACGRGRRS